MPSLARAYFCHIARSDDINVFCCHIARMRAMTHDDLIFMLYRDERTTIIHFNRIATSERASTWYRIATSERASSGIASRRASERAVVSHRDERASEHVVLHRDERAREHVVSRSRERASTCDRDERTILLSFAREATYCKKRRRRAYFYVVSFFISIARERAK
jgi:hypothetical protein